MSDHDQHGNHFPDTDHLHKWPSDAYPEGDQEPATYRIPKRVVWFLGTAFLVQILFTYYPAWREMREKQESVSRQNETHKKEVELHKEKGKALKQTTGDFSKAMREYRLTTGPQDKVVPPKGADQK